jgi:TolB-like protein/thioredoxin-like negative regulator of GroEL
MMFFNELKRRNVLRVGAAYVVTAWLLIQVSETIFPLFGFGDSPARLVVIVLAIGFIPALIFAWAFQLTPDGLKKDGDVDHSYSVAPQAGKKLDRMIMFVLALALGYFSFDKFVLSPARENEIAEQARQAGAKQALEESRLDRQNEKSVAILPFTILGKQEETGFFADGIHDDLLTRLANIGSLKVISRTSVLQYRDTARNLREIGRELGATAIMEGSIQQAGSNVRINMQLINAETDEHLWAQTYDRALTLENVFNIQSEIAEAIAGQLAATLSPTERSRIHKKPTLNFEAHKAYIQGRQLFTDQSFTSLRTAQTRFEQALEIDPDYTDARVGLAHAYAQLAHTGAITVQVMLHNGQPQIDRAIAEDPENSYAQAVYGLYRYARDRDDAEKTFLYAIELNPNDVDALDIYADYLRDEERHEEALPVIRRALDLDPLSVTLFHDLGRSEIALGHFEEAQFAFDRIAQINPGNPFAAHGSGLSTILSGQLFKAAYWSDQGQIMDPADYEQPATSAFIYTSLGNFEMAQQRIEEAFALAENQPYPLAAQAYYLKVTGQPDRALAIARAFLANQLEDRWGSENIMLHLLQDAAITSGDYEEALGWYRKLIPECLQQPPVVDALNIQKAVDLAYLLLLDGQKEQAENLLNVIVDSYNKLYVRGRANFPMGIANVDALALLGQKTAAIAALQRHVDDGFRLRWRWSTELNRNQASLQDDPDYVAIIDWLRSDIAAQLEASRTYHPAWN